jgi:2-amino-4-hydroxy-6-hydroxymethyldihydropteridine diphosphokinase
MTDGARAAAGRPTSTERESTVFVGLGSNCGDRLAQLRRAMSALDSLPGTRIAATSSVYQTTPWGLHDQPDFLNAVVKVSTRLEPRDLLDACLAIEERMGRRREGPQWGPRSIDLDLLLWEGETRERVGLVLPHAGLALRRFVLVPLHELAPEERDPRSGRTVHELLESCPDRGRVERFAK